MKKVKYPNLDDYDLSAYEELKGDILYTINGGEKEMTPEDKNRMAQAAAHNDRKTQDEIREKYREDDPPSTTTPTTTTTTTQTTPPPTSTTPPATNTNNPTTSPTTTTEKPKQTPKTSPTSGSSTDGGTTTPTNSGNNSTGGANNYNGSTGNTGNTSQNNKPVSEEERYYQAGLAHVEDYKNAALNNSTIKGNDVVQNVTLTGRNLTGRGFPSSTDGFRPVEVKSGSPGSLARKGYPSTTEGYPNAYNTIEKQPLMGESIYSEYYIRKNVPEQYQEAAIRAMHEEEKRGLYGSPTDSKRMTTRVGVKTKYQDRHTGIDIGALKKDENDIPIKGDPIYATADGKVIDFRYTENSGSTLLELSLPGTKDRAIYQHADFIVKPGDEVKRGQIIGYMDSINVGANQVHLHYEIRHNGIYALSEGGVLVDPTLHMPGTYYFDKNQ